MSSYDTPEALRANYEALREQEGYTWAQLHEEIRKQVPADDKTLLPWSAAKARAEAAAEQAAASTRAPRGRSASKGKAETADGGDGAAKADTADGASTADGSEQGAAGDGDDDQIEG